jgi:hypothetical protein
MFCFNDKVAAQQACTYTVNNIAAINDRLSERYGNMAMLHNYCNDNAQLMRSKSYDFIEIRITQRYRDVQVRRNDIVAIWMR